MSTGDTSKRQIASRKAHMGIVTRKRNEFDSITVKSTDDVTSGDKILVEAALESLLEKSKILDQINLEILNDTENTEEALEAEIVIQDENSTKLKGLIKSMQKWISEHTVDATDDETSSISSSHPSHRENNVRLPRIEVPTFDGQYKDWKTFFDMFKGTVHNQPTLPKVQKLYYLKGALKGEAKRVLAHLPTTEANYDVALKFLQDRYDNQFLITKAHLSNIFKIDPMK